MRYNKQQPVIQPQKREVSIEEQESLDEINALNEKGHLILYNDEVNTFEHVIDTLIEVCGHTQEQAMQCATITHNNGKCAVKSGAILVLSNMCVRLLDRKLNAMVE